MPVEQLFSTAGLILNEKRSQLSPFRMNMICFVHDNYKLVRMGYLEHTVSVTALIRKNDMLFQSILLYCQKWSYLRASVVS